LDGEWTHFIGECKNVQYTSSAPTGVVQKSRLWWWKMYVRKNVQLYPWKGQKVSLPHSPPKT
jgi:hypothetical protein